MFKLKYLPLLSFLFLNNFTNSTAYIDKIINNTNHGLFIEYYQPHLTPRGLLSEIRSLKTNELLQLKQSNSFCIFLPKQTEAAFQKLPIPILKGNTITEAGRRKGLNFTFDGIWAPREAHPGPYLIIRQKNNY